MPDEDTHLLQTIKRLFMTRETFYDLVNELNEINKEVATLRIELGETQDELSSVQGDYASLEEFTNEKVETCLRFMDVIGHNLTELETNGKLSKSDRIVLDDTIKEFNNLNTQIKDGVILTEEQIERNIKEQEEKTQLHKLRMKYDLVYKMEQDGTNLPF